MATTTVPQTRALYRLSVHQDHRMGEAGILKSSEKVELLEGLLIAKPTKSPAFATAVTLLQAKLHARLSRDWIVRIQSPITTADSEPEPDAVLVPGPPDRDFMAHPVPADVALVIEVSDSSLADDRDVQQRIYARARIPIYWIVNIPDGQIEVYTQPRGGKDPTYRERRDYPRGGTIPLVLAGQEVSSVPVVQVLPLIPRPESQP